MGVVTNDAAVAHYEHDRDTDGEPDPVQERGGMSMNRLPLTPGRMAYLAGRDQEGALSIAEVDSDFVLIADGGLRGIDRPKKSGASI